MTHHTVSFIHTHILKHFYETVGGGSHLIGCVMSLKNPLNSTVLRSVDSVLVTSYKL